MRSDRESSIYLHVKPSAQSDHNNLQSSCNGEPKCDYIITKVHNRCITYCDDLYQTNGFKELDKISIEMKFECHTYFMGTGKIFVMDCYRFFTLLLCYIHLLTQFFV